MARTSIPQPASSKPEPNDHRTAVLAVAAVAVIAVGVFLATAASPADQSTSTPASTFTASGTAMAGNVTVDGSEITMGNVALNVTVTPTWTLVNTGTEAVTLGEPHASVIEGCCPGPLTLDQTDLAPGQSTILTFPLQMHPGMDGPHDFDIHIPLQDSSDVLTLGVSGIFG